MTPLVSFVFIFCILFGSHEGKERLLIEEKEEVHQTHTKKKEDSFFFAWNFILDCMRTDIDSNFCHRGKDIKAAKKKNSFKGE